MIIIQNTTIAEVHNVIAMEVAASVGVGDTIDILRAASNDVNDRVDAYVTKNAIVKSIDSQVKSKISNKSNVIDAIKYASVVLNDLLPKVEGILKSGRTKTFDTETVTFKEHAIFDLISSIDFFNRYARMLLDVVLEASTTNVDPSRYLNKVDFAFFNNTNKYFTILLLKFNGGSKAIIDALNNMSDEIYDSASASIIAEMEGPQAVTLKGLAPHELNPYFWYKKSRMKADLKRITVCRDENDTLAMKISRMENRLRDNPDPSLESAIEAYENIIIKNRAEIAEIEAKYE